MNLEEKLRRLQCLSEKTCSDRSLERELESLCRLQPEIQASPFCGDRAPNLAPGGLRTMCRVEESIEGRMEAREFGEVFIAEQALPFGRPYGKLRIGDIAAAELAPLALFGVSPPRPERLIFLDTETTGPAGTSGVFAFLIGIGRLQDGRFLLRQYFLRDGDDEKSALAALAEELENCDGLVTFNGKTFDVPLLETRYGSQGMAAPFKPLVHLDLLHPARQLWKLRLRNCKLANLERHVLGLAREGDIPGSEIPGIYFDYLRTGDARGLQPVFFHNALDVITLAALGAEMARVIQSAQRENFLLAPDAGLDLFSLSRIFERAGARDISITACRRALSAGLPDELETRALWHLARQHKRRGEFREAAEIWQDLLHRADVCAIDAHQELALYCERRERDLQRALAITEAVLAILNGGSGPSLAPRSRARHIVRFTRRRERLQRRMKKRAENTLLAAPSRGKHAVAAVSPPPAFFQYLGDGDIAATARPNTHGIKTMPWLPMRSAKGAASSAPTSLPLARSERKLGAKLKDARRAKSKRPRAGQHAVGT